MSKEHASVNLKKHDSSGFVVYKAYFPSNTPHESCRLWQPKKLAEKLRCHTLTIRRKSNAGKLETYRFAAKIVRYREPGEKDESSSEPIVSRQWVAKRWDMNEDTIINHEQAWGLHPQEIDGKSKGYRLDDVLRVERQALVSTV